MIKYLLFDLDNTLYSCSYGLEANVARRIKEFTAAFLGLPPDEAWKQRKAVVKQYGTCLEWLMAEKGFTDVESYFTAIHPQGEADSLLPDPQLKTFLKSIPIPKAILTNSPREHADMIIEKLELGGIFTHIFDIRQCNFLGKPRLEVFNNALNTLQVHAHEVLFIDDYPIYVQGFIAMGGNALLFDERDVHGDKQLPRIQNLKEIISFLIPNS